MNIEANDLWERIDKKNPYNTLSKLIDEAGLDYRNVKKQRYLDRVPRSEDLYQISSKLGCSMEYLLTGDDYKTYPERIERIITNLMYTATEEDLRLVERVLRIKEKEDAGNG